MERWKTGTKLKELLVGWVGRFSPDTYHFPFGRIPFRSNS